MSKELEALKQVKNFLGYNYCSVDLPNELRTIEQALQRLESIDNAKPSEALNCLNDIYRNGVFISDCDGEIKSTTCGKIYNLIKDIDEPNLKLRYDYYSDNDWEDFKSLLKECYSKRMKLVWY